MTVTYRQLGHCKNMFLSRAICLWQRRQRFAMDCNRFLGKIRRADRSYSSIELSTATFWWRVCGLGEKDGVELQVDHITPRSKGGKAELDNAQTLCGSHNYRKNKLGQLEFGADMFKRLRRKAKAAANTDAESQQVVKFCDEILALYAKFNFDDRRSVD